MSTLKKGNRKEADFATQLVAGAQKHLSNIGQLVIEGSTFTPAEAQAKLIAFANLRNDVDAARATLKAKLTAEMAQLAGLREFFLAFVTFVKAAFGNSPDILADFGVKPKKARKPLTVEQKAAAAAKRKSTRAARGVIGTRKRAVIKGDVTGVVVSPVKGAQPEPGAHPAQQASNASNDGNAAK
ncbi:MAG TPA: hypothetical protein VGY54_27085 [Polyangiaceae bacterium]|jgi:hypothetical protein|nr:hypothetical protein [Polyangiaceae bacterium]